MARMPATIGSSASGSNVPSERRRLGQRRREQEVEAARPTSSPCGACSRGAIDARQVLRRGAGTAELGERPVERVDVLRRRSAVPRASPSRSSRRAVLVAYMTEKCWPDLGLVERAPDGASSTRWPSDSRSCAGAARRRRRTRRGPGPCSPGARVRRPMRSGPARRRPRRGTAAPAAAPMYGSPGMQPAIASRIAAVSRTLRVTHALADEAADAVAEVGTERGAPARRLQADEAALARRDADRAAAVVGVRRGDQAGRDGGRRAAARAARRVARGPTDCASARRRPARSSAACRARACWCGRG